ncbi:MAG: chitin-binding protein, partial [Anaerolineae bacterium]|nr:chitin-binding protein [Anaerolineae bacterium]
IPPGGGPGMGDAGGRGHHSSPHRRLRPAGGAGAAEAPAPGVRPGPGDPIGAGGAYGSGALTPSPAAFGEARG